MNNDVQQNGQIITLGGIDYNVRKDDKGNERIYDETGRDVLGPSIRFWRKDDKLTQYIGKDVLWVNRTDDFVNELVFEKGDIHYIFQEWPKQFGFCQATTRWTKIPFFNITRADGKTHPMVVSNGTLKPITDDWFDACEIRANLSQQLGKPGEYVFWCVDRSKGYKYFIYNGDGIQYVSDKWGNDFEAESRVKDYIRRVNESNTNLPNKLFGNTKAFSIISECIDEGIERAQMKNKLKSMIREEFSRLTEDDKAKQSQMVTRKRTAVKKLLKDPKFNHAQLAYALYKPKNQGEKDTARSLFSKKATGTPDTDGVVREFDSVEVNKLYQMLRKR